MPVTWWLALIYPLPLLAIPLAVLLGRYIRGGAVAVMSGGAALAAGVFWLTLRGIIVMRINGDTFVNLLVEFYAALLAIVLLVCAWTLALIEAFRERRWGWVAAQFLAVYLSFAAVIVYLMGPYSSCYSNPKNFIMCSTIDESVGSMLIACMFAGPLALLAYALRTTLRLHTHARPDDRVVSHMDAE